MAFPFSVRNIYMVCNETPTRGDTMKTKIMFVSIAVLAAIAATGLVSFELLVRQVQERFPFIREDVVRKAYANMLVNGLKGEYGNFDDTAEHALDDIFLTEVYKIIYAR